MNSLNEHLCAGAAHDGLPFHASCPICVERRLHGCLEVRPLVPASAQAAVLAGVLAASTAVPPATAFAAEADRTNEGAAAVSESGTGDRAASTDFDPGGDDAALPEEAPPAATPAATPDDSAPVDAAPAVDTPEPEVDAGDAVAPPPAAPPSPAPAPPTAAPAPAPAPQSTPPAAATSSSAAAESPVEASSAKRETTKRSSTRRERSPDTKPRTTRANSTAPAARPVTPTTMVPVAATSAPAPARISVSGASHVVRSGESLWAIAAALVGADASPAQIAREVQRLWQLNADRIGTGSPDLLHVGTRLDLR